MNEDDEKTGAAQAIIDFAERRTTPEEYTFTDPEGIAPDVVAIVGFDGANGTVVIPIDFKRDAYRKQPLRRKGTITTHTLESFIAVTNRDKRPDSVIFADVPARKLTAILDFHGPADSAPRFGEDRVVYGFELSKQLEAWLAAARNLMDQKTFSRLIDDRLGDIGEGPFEAGSIAAEFARRRGIAFASIPDLVVFTRTIATKSTTAATEQIDEHTGDVSIQFAKRGDVQTPDGKSVPVPYAFVLKIPVLSGLGATEFNIPVRLRYAIEDKGITWRIELHALDKYIQSAVDEAVKKVTGDAPDGCGLPVFMGSPP